MQLCQITQMVRVPLQAVRESVHKPHTVQPHARIPSRQAVLPAGKQYCLAGKQYCLALGMSGVLHALKRGPAAWAPLGLSSTQLLQMQHGCAWIKKDP